MKAIDIALKDLTRSFRSAFAVIFMFGVPLLVTGMFYLMFGNMAQNGGFDLPKTKVVIANMDAGGPKFQLNPRNIPGGRKAETMGDLIVSILESDEMADLIEVAYASDPQIARTAVDSQQAQVAIIIPADFSEQFADVREGQAVIEFYQDPTLTIGPGIVKDLASHFMDGFSGAKIASQTAISRLSAHGVQADQDLAGQVAQQYVAWQQTSGHDENSAVPRLAILSPSGEVQANAQKAVPIGPIMAGMMVFFVFFIGANEAASLIREAEEGTLARILTTPTSQAILLTGKFLGVAVSLAIQVVLLLLASSFLFRINWGQPATVILVAFGLIVAAAGFGVMIMSFIKNSRQAGPVLGGVMTLAGMLGGLFTTGLPNLPATAAQVGLVTPHGWALQAWKLSLSGAGPVQALTPILVLAGLGLVFLAAGIALFRKRFA
jgi:ABC-type multidrug transport system permease subunit